MIYAKKKPRTCRSYKPPQPLAKLLIRKHCLVKRPVMRIVDKTLTQILAFRV